MTTEPEYENWSVCNSCGLDHLAPALEHLNGCVHKLTFYGGLEEWGIGKDGEHRTKEDGTKYIFNAAMCVWYWNPVPVEYKHKCSSCNREFKICQYTDMCICRFCPICGEQRLC